MTQLDLFTGQPVAEKPAKKAKPQQAELFPSKALAQFGVRANPKMDLSPGRLALHIQDTRTADEIERERMEDAQALTEPLAGTSQAMPDAGDIAAIEYNYTTRAFTLRLKDGKKRQPRDAAELRRVKGLYILWPLLMVGGGKIVKAPENNPAAPATLTVRQQYEQAYRLARQYPNGGYMQSAPHLYGGDLFKGLQPTIVQHAKNSYFHRHDG